MNGPRVARPGEGPARAGGEELVARADDEGLAGAGDERLGGANGVGRRAFLGGSLLLTFSLAAPIARGQAPAGPGRAKLPGDLDRHRQLDAWLRIGADGRVTLKTGKVELGQGVLTALGQICADELDVALAHVDVVSGDTQVCPNQGVTAGSLSMPQGGTAVRQVAAEARALLLELASKRLGVPAERLAVSDGTIAERPGAKSITYGAL
ncbi:MAG TPA: molybdopterin cofactor-binding domain-containing protein, partial [Polyangiaceae bacterium]|nr:molybdopterin cofactor-binding domain-containing protein [Polyangiaceae bacterium]